MTVNIYFVRHGQTLLNMYSRIQGICDAPLTDKGIKDAKKAGQRLKGIKFDAAYSSDAPRAINTGKAILAANPSDIKAPTINKAFREENFGYFEGSNGSVLWNLIGGKEGATTFNDIMSHFGVNGALDKIKEADGFKNAESSEDVKKRFEPGVKDIVSKANDGDNILVASHGTIIRWIARNYGDDDLKVDHPTRNGSVTKMTVTDGKFHIEYFDDLDTIN